VQLAYPQIHNPPTSYQLLPEVSTTLKQEHLSTHHASLRGSDFEDRKAPHFASASAGCPHLHRCCTIFCTPKPSLRSVLHRLHLCLAWLFSHIETRPSSASHKPYSSAHRLLQTHTQPYTSPLPPSVISPPLLIQHTLRHSFPLLRFSSIQSSKQGLPLITTFSLLNEYKITSRLQLSNFQLPTHITCQPE